MNQVAGGCNSQQIGEWLKASRGMVAAAMVAGTKVTTSSWLVTAMVCVYNVSNLCLLHCFVGQKHCTQ
jgi:hypothetical protein